MRVVNWRGAVGAAGALSLVGFVVYAMLAARDILFGDGGELTVAAATNGVAHPPGYPLWIVFGHLFSLLPVGTIPYRINLSASLYHAIVVGLVFVSAFVLTRRFLPAFIAALLLATTPLFVTWSLQAEVFSLNDVFVAAIVLLSLLVIDNGARWRLAFPIAALFGLGLANQQTLLFLAPLPIYAFALRRKTIPKTAGALAVFAAAAVALCVGFALPYVHTLLASQRDLGWAFGQARTLGDLVSLITRNDYGATTMVNGPLAGGSIGGRLYVMMLAIGVVAAAAFLGAAAQARKAQYEIAAAVAMIFTCTVVIFCAIANNNAAIVAAQSIFLRFALMPLVALAPFAALAVPAIERFNPLPGRLRLVPNVAILSLILALGIHTSLTHSLAHMHDARTLIRDEFAALPRGAVAFVAGDAVATTAPYFQIVEGLRPDITLVFVDLLPGKWYADRLRRTISIPATDGPPSIDDIVAANPSRRFFGIGDPAVQGAINASGGPYVALTRGLVSQITPRGTFIPLRKWYVREVQQQNTLNYGALSNGDAPFTAVAQAYYANGYYNLGLDAERLGDSDAARKWFALALAHVPESPTILGAITHLAQLPPQTATSTL